MTRRNWVFLAMALAALGVTGFGGMTLATASSERADCPGKIVCPLTGEPICRDKCPRVDKNRSDCPGQIVCPLTGELICKDRCLLGGTSTAQPQTEVPACCQGKRSANP